ncbi:MAG: hypothetical protein ACI9EZ_001459 [Halobacteriales archaeon]|jgi:hypothetical protein
MHRRTLLAVAVFALSIVIVTSTGSFTSASVERGVSVAVADDDHAFVGVEAKEPVLDNGNYTVTLMEVSNRFNSDLEEVSVESDAVIANAETTGPPPVIKEVWTVDSQGDARTIQVKASVTCSNAASGGTVPVHLTVSTGGVSVEMTRSAYITCTGEPHGNGSPASSSESSSANNSSSGSSTATSTAES